MATLTNCDHLFDSIAHYFSVLTLVIAGVTIATRRLKITQIVCIGVCGGGGGIGRVGEPVSESERKRESGSERLGVREWE
jgi:hypothetical protein